MIPGVAEKLRSILRLIHWSLVLKAAVFGASWFFLPFWAFIFIALYLYFVPFFRVFTMILPFVLVIFFATIEQPQIWTAIFLAILFYLVAGIKDLAFVERRTWHEILVFLLIFLMYIMFFARFDAWDAAGAFFYSALMGVVIFFLCRGYLHHAHSTSQPELPRAAFLAVALAAFLIFQIAIVVVFLPLNFLYQSALLFIASVVLLESVFDYARASLTRNRILTNISALLVFLVIILGSAQWSL